MNETKYLFYKDFLNKKEIIDNCVLVSKIDNSYLLGPIINDDFDSDSFIKRVSSSSVYSIRKYRRVKKSIILDIINKYYKELKSNEVLEITTDNKKIKHKILKVPGDEDEE